MMARSGWKFENAFESHPWTGKQVMANSFGEISVIIPKDRVGQAARRRPTMVVNNLPHFTE